MEKRREAIKKRWEEKRFQAAVWRDYQLESAQRLYEAEVEQVEREFEEERGRLKEKLITELLEERRRLMDELEPTLSVGVSSHSSAPSVNSNLPLDSLGKRSLRKRTAEDQLPNGNTLNNTTNGNGLKTLSGRDTQRRRPNANGNQFDQLGRMGIETRLGEEELSEDVQALATTRRPNQNHQMSINTSPERKRSKPPSGPKGPTAVISSLHDTLIDAHVTSASDSILHYNHLHVFQRGDPVQVLVTVSDSTFTGTISTIGANELWIRREDGTKNKIYLGQLRIGKYKLAPPNTPFP